MKQKKLTLAQARKMHERLLKEHPELADWPEKKLIEKPLSKTEQALADARTKGYMEGRYVSKEEYEAQMKEKDKAFAERRKNLHLETLKAVRDLASAYGQMMGEIARAMQSEKGQI